MSLLDDLNNINDSDSENDEDYVPAGAVEESEEDSDAAVASDEDAESKKKKGKKQQKKKKLQATGRKRKGGICLEGGGEEAAEEEESKEEEAEEEPQKEKTDEYDKVKADSLWADFLKDVEPPPPKSLLSSTSSSSIQESPREPTTESKPCSTTEKEETSPPKKITITQEFDFAGETVQVTKEVEADSKEAANGTSNTPLAPTKRKSGLAGLVGSLSNKKPKMSTLTKSQLDWQKYKDEEGISEELDQYKKGKDGYLNRQAFLHQVDLNQFELEKKIREKNRSSRTPLL